MDFSPGSGKHLCAVCAHCRKIPHPRGGTPYYRCLLADSNRDYSRFPRIPVLRCPGFAPEAADTVD